MAMSFPLRLWRRFLVILFAALTFCAPEALRAQEHRSGVAVYPFRTVLHGTAPETLRAHAELFSALLTARLAESDHIVMLDRTQLEALFDERPLLLGEKQPGGMSLPILPLSDYTVTGTLFTEKGSPGVSIRVVRNSNGEILGILRTRYETSVPTDAVGVVANWIGALIQRVELATQTSVTTTDQRIGFGTFECLSEDALCHEFAGTLSDRLTERYLANDRYRLVSRAQLVPLVIEDILRNSQQIARMDTIAGRGARYLVHGKLKREGSSGGVSLYLYLEDVKQERTLEVLKANDWESLFAQADEAIATYFRLSRGVREILPRKATAKAAERFLAALKQLQVVSEGESSFSGLSRNQIEILAHQKEAGPGHAKALALIDRALAHDADYLPALIVRAILIGAKGDAARARTILKHVADSKDPAVEHIAFELLQRQWRTGSRDIRPNLFEDIVGGNRAPEVVSKLIDEGYLTKSNDALRIDERYTDRIINRTHLLTLNGVPDDTAIRIFDRLRAISYGQGKEVRFITPKRYHTRDLKSFRTWRQSLFEAKHGTESVMLREFGKGGAGITIVQLGEMTYAPSIHYDDDTSPARIESGVDGLASSVFVEPTNLQSFVLLGHALCAEAIGQCSTGRMMNTWVIDYTNRAYPDRRHGVPGDFGDLDGLIFLAAVAVDALEQANLTATVRATGYYREALRMIRQHKQLERKVAEHALSVLAACRELHDLRSNLRSLRKIEKYVKPMKLLAQLAMENDQAKPLRAQQLAHVEHECPEGYPYLVLAMGDNAQFLVLEQDEMVARVLEGEIIPALISEFVSHSITLFERRVDSGQLDAAKAYIGHYARYFGITAETALDFAYLYHRVGDQGAVEKVLRDNGRDRFELSGYPIPAINGHYIAEGFDKKDRLVYRNQSNGGAFLRYEGNVLKYTQFGMLPAKWDLRLTLPSRRQIVLRSNRNDRHPEKFCFDNGGEVTGDIHWPLQGESPTLEAGKTDETPVPVETLQPIPAAEFVAPVLMDGHVLSPGHGYAIKGFPYGHAAGPLLPIHFRKSLAVARDVNALIEKLFALDYLTVSGVPKIEPRKVRERIAQDFPELSLRERRSLRDAILLAGKKRGAGYAEIRWWNGREWLLGATISARDAEQHNGFGQVVSLSDNYAFVCDRKGGLYVFHRGEGGWQQTQRLSASCASVAGNDRWAVTRDRGKLVVFSNLDGVWRQHQELYPHNHLLREDQGRTFEFYGEALLLEEGTLLVGDPLYAEGGEITRYVLVEGQWKESAQLTSPQSSIRFGKSLAANYGYLVVGSTENDPTKSPFERGGQALVYRAGDDGWRLVTKLVPNEGEERQFARALWISSNQPNSLYIQSKDNVYRYTLPSLRWVSD